MYPTEKKPDAKPGAVRLLSQSDASTDLVGWQPSQEGIGSLINPKGWAMLRVVVQKIIDGQPKDLYDQPIIVENPGAIVVCRAGDKVGLVQNFRFTGRRLMDAGRDYVRRLEADGRWAELAATLGSWQWELPRGLTQITPETDIERFVIATAKAEALEEAGFSINNARLAGLVNVNATFFAHAQYAVEAWVTSNGQNRPEDLEIIGITKLFSPADLRRLADAGELQDGLSLAALALVGFRF